VTLHLLHVSIDGEPCRVEIRTPATGGRQFFFARGEKPLEEISAEAVTLEPGVISITTDGRSLEARLDVKPQSTAVLLNGRRYEFSQFDPRSLQARRATAGGDDGPRTLKSPMPGRVLRILAVAGSPVAAQQGILVVEAMKMQNELKSPKEGTVTRVLVAEGDTVTAGQALAIIS
jgi:biotin carboxyl carrier protein